MDGDSIGGKNEYFDVQVKARLIEEGVKILNIMGKSKSLYAFPSHVASCTPLSVCVCTMFMI